MRLFIVVLTILHSSLGYFDLEKVRSEQSDPNNPVANELSLYPDFVNWKKLIGHDSIYYPDVYRDTLQGRIRGFSVAAHYDIYTFVNVFLGIPFARPPIRERRFKKPEVPLGRNTDYDASFYRPACPQPYELMRETIPSFNYTNEDCLYLNIFEPERRLFSNDQVDKRYPVMVYFHGGMFKQGSAMNYPGLVLAQRDMIVVTVQYRLGPLGFITINERDPCNLGLLDQMEALVWIRENIQFFNGDPNKVTIFGHEAGAASVGLQMISPHNRRSASNRLFQRAIMMSGSDLSQWAVIPKHALLYTHELARRVQCGGYIGLPDNLLSCLRSKHPDELVLASVDLMRGDTAGPFAPMVDDFSDESFINLMPREIRKNYPEQVASIPILAGFSKDDGANILKRNFSYVFQNVRAGVSLDEFNRVTYNVSLRRNARDARQVAQAVNFQYTYWSNPDNDTARRQMLVDIFTDEFYAAGADEVLKLHSRKMETESRVNLRTSPDSSFSTFMYKFDYRSERENLATEWMGADQDSTLRYLFGWPYMNSTYQNITGMTVHTAYGELDRNISNGTMQMFKEFAMLGQPIVNQNNLLPYNFKNLSWYPFKSNNVTYFAINYNSTNNREYHQGQLAFWQSYIQEILQIELFTTTPFFTTAYPYEAFQVATYALSGTVLVLIIVVASLALAMIVNRKSTPAYNKSSYYCAPGQISTMNPSLL